MLLAVHRDLGYDRLDVIGLLDGRERMCGARDPLERARPLRTALADLVVGHEQDGLG